MAASLPNPGSGWLLSSDGPGKERLLMYDPERIHCWNTDAGDGRLQMIFVAMLLASSVISAAMIVASAGLTVVAHPRSDASCLGANRRPPALRLRSEPQ